MADSILNSFDRIIVGAVEMKIVPGGQESKIDFQFAPRIVSDSNSSRWREYDSFSIEPFRIHAGSDGRKIQMEWEYIASSSIFDGELIATNLRNLKSYFFDFKPDKYPVVKLKYPPIVPTEILFRLLDVNITHGPDLVLAGNGVYPLYTKVGCSLQIATSLSGGASEEAKVKTPPVSDVSVDVEWY